jgi:quinol monooxygenase YgiN
VTHGPIVVTLRLTPADPEAFHRFLADILPDSRKAKGCRYSKTFVGNDGSDVLLLQEWDSAEDQQAYMACSRSSSGILRRRPKSAFGRRQRHRLEPRAPCSHDAFDLFRVTR